jgi:hypothetical protein
LRGAVHARKIDGFAVTGKGDASFELDGKRRGLRLAVLRDELLGRRLFVRLVVLHDEPAEHRLAQAFSAHDRLLRAPETSSL